MCIPMFCGHVHQNMACIPLSMMNWYTPRGKWYVPCMVVAGDQHCTRTFALGHVLPQKISTKIVAQPRSAQQWHCSTSNCDASNPGSGAPQNISTSQQLPTYASARWMPTQSKTLPSASTLRSNTPNQVEEQERQPHYCRG